MKKTNFELNFEEVHRVFGTRSCSWRSISWCFWNPAIFLSILDGLHIEPKLVFRKLRDSVCCSDGCPLTGNFVNCIYFAGWSMRELEEEKGRLQRAKVDEDYMCGEEHIN